jgi:predicted DNA-binding transcriptional regulator YafY
MEREADGSLLVKFRAGGAREICWHLFTWGEGVEILEPDEMGRNMIKMITSYQSGTPKTKDTSDAGS